MAVAARTVNNLRNKKTKTDSFEEARYLQNENVLFFQKIIDRLTECQRVENKRKKEAGRRQQQFAKYKLSISSILETSLIFTRVPLASGTDPHDVHSLLMKTKLFLFFFFILLILLAYAGFGASLIALFYNLLCLSLLFPLLVLCGELSPIVLALLCELLLRLVRYLDSKIHRNHTD